MTAASEQPRGVHPNYGPGNGTSLLLSQPFIVERMDDADETYLVASPLRYLRFDRDSGVCTDAPIHSKPRGVSS